MENTKQAWTPGPWRIDGVFPNEPMNIEGQAFDGSWKYICIAIHGGNPKQREANAKLIAKAPELFDALLELHRFTHNCPIELHERIERILRECGAID